MAITWNKYFRESTIFRCTHISIIYHNWFTITHPRNAYMHYACMYVYIYAYTLISYSQFILRCTPARYICSTADTIHCCMQCRILCWSSGQMGGPWKINCTAGFRKFNDCWEYFPTSRRLSRRPSEKVNLPRAMCSPRMMTFSFVNWLTLW